MKLCELNQEIEALIRQLEPDPETGEIPMNEEEILAELEGLAGKRMQVLDWISKKVLNIRSDIAGLKSEIDRLSRIKKGLEGQEARLMDVLGRECGGENTQFSVAKGCYRTTHPVNIWEEGMLYDWLSAHEYEDCYSTEVKFNKNAVKRLIEEGLEVPGAEIAERQSFSLR